RRREGRAAGERTSGPDHLAVVEPSPVDQALRQRRRLPPHREQLLGGRARLAIPLGWRAVARPKRRTYHACDLAAPTAPEIGPAALRPRVLQRAQRPDPRRRRLPGGLHDRLRDVALLARDARRRPGDHDRDAPERALDPDFVLIARTDARGATGGSLDDAIRRANAYLAAGADLAFVEGPTSVEEVRRVCREVKGPVFYNQTGVSPRFSLAQMQELGI